MQSFNFLNNYSHATPEQFQEGAVLANPVTGDLVSLIQYEGNSSYRAVSDSGKGDEFTVAASDAEYFLFVDANAATFYKHLSRVDYEEHLVDRLNADAITERQHSLMMTTFQSINKSDEGLQSVELEYDETCGYSLNVVYW